MSFSKVLDNIKNGDFTGAKKEIYGILDEEKIEQKDLRVVEEYYNTNKSPFAGYILYKTQCILGKYFEAYSTYMELINQGIRKKDITFEDVVNGASENEIELIARDILKKLDEDDIIQSLLIKEVIDLIIPVLWKSDVEEKYKIISEIASKLWFGDLKQSECLHEIAFACEKQKNELSEKLYLKVVEREPANCILLNEIGLMYEKRNEMRKAEKYFRRAYEFCRENKEYRENLERVEKIS